MRHLALIAALALSGCVTTLSDVRDAHDARPAGDMGTIVALAWDERDDTPTLTARCRGQVTNAVVVDAAPDVLREACRQPRDQRPNNECATYVQDCVGLGTIWGCNNAALVVWVDASFSPRRRCHSVIHGLLHAAGACSGEGTDRPHMDARRWVHAYEPESSAPPDVVERAAREVCP